MTTLASLWLPILLSAAAVFAVSSLIHMMTPWHKSDYPKLADEDRVRDALRPLAIPPGDYMMPTPASREDMRSPEFAAKLTQGPNILLTVFPYGPPQMARPLTVWFLYGVIVSVIAAYVAGRALPPGSEYLRVFRFVGVTTFACYSVALWQASIWYHRPWSTTAKATIDGLLYALLTAGIFGWLWPN